MLEFMTNITLAFLTIAAFCGALALALFCPLLIATVIQAGIKRWKRRR